MSKIKDFVCLILLVLLPIIASVVSGQIAIKDERAKNNTHLMSTYANIIYAFGSNKEDVLIKISSKIIGTQIAYLKTHNEDIQHHKYLCPYLVAEFKNIISKNYCDSDEIEDACKKEKLDFLNGYEKLADLCKK